jgi:hypothetical protein
MYVSLYFHSKGFGEEAAGKPTVSSLHFLGYSPLPGRSFVLVQEEDDQLSLSLSPEQDSPGIVCRVAICHLVLNIS